MLFNSAQFLFCFLPIAVLGFALLARFGRTTVVVWLAFMSLVFYAYWRMDFLALLIGSISVNFVCSRLLWRYREREGLKKLILTLGVIANLGLLAYFKYLFPLLHFLSDSLGLPLVVGGVILPLGISFFTFTQIAYLIDLSEDSAEPQDFVSYVLFVTFFPHLIAGPILHHSEIMPQFTRERDFSLKWNDLALGLSWFILGLGKKVLIADRLAPHADATFANAANLTMIGGWVGVLNYALQLYFDFSGYSDMAIGLARMFSIEFPYNFDSPYKAGGIIEFWSRWHMTLTRYLTLYLYNPFAMWINRRRARAGKLNSRKAQRTLAGFSSLVALPTIMTMFIAGVWHGAGLQFIVFGLLHGSYLTINHAWRFFRREGALLTRIISSTPVSVLLTFGAVLMAQIFFRASSTHNALQMLAGLFGRNGLGLQAAHSMNPHALFVFAMLPVVWFFPNTQEILGQTETIRPNVFGTGHSALWRPNMVWAGVLGALFVGVLWYMSDTSAFLYFQF
jgi:D-alanyl-lipoteichoic acid acyltransferase DltB (MBOAT superfamily)